MRIDPAGWPFILGALVPALVLAAAGHPWWALPFAVLTCVFLFFFRDPHRTVGTSARTDVLSPADGRVVVSGAANPDAAPPGTWKQISIFLSPLDVHVNRIPVSGRVARVDVRRGRFLPAYRPEAASQNERIETWIDHHGQMIVCRQVVGVLARRIVSRVSEGDEVHAGDRYGVMKFGSRIDLYMPATAELSVSVGDRVVAGVTIVARLPEGEA